MACSRVNFLTLYPEIKDTNLLRSFNWEVFDHPTHSPDLAATDVHLALHLKKHLDDQKFHEDEEVEYEFAMWLHVQMVEFCDIRIQKLISRLHKYLDKSGDYVEK